MVGLLSLGLLIGTVIVPAGSAVAEKKGGGTAQSAKKKKKKKKKAACKGASASKKKTKKKAKQCPAPATPPGSTPTAPGPTPADPSTPTTPPVPSPEFEAPPLDQTIATSMDDSAAFLYEGSDPVQEGVADGTIEERRVAVLSGRVLDGTGAALPGVTVAILDHPELGSTQTRSDGLYDIAVNGGGPLVLTFEKGELLPVERRIEVPWQDYVPVADVALVELDPADEHDPVGRRRQPGRSRQRLDRSAGLPPHDDDLQAGDDRRDRAGQRQHPAAARAMDGAGDGVDRRRHRTERDAREPAADLRLHLRDRASASTRRVAAGAVRTNFSNPVAFYVENFINMPVGATCPPDRWTPRPGAGSPSRTAA